MSDPIDAFWPERLDSFEGKKLRSVTQAAEDLGKGDDQPDISPLLAAMKTALGDRVADVRSTARLTDSAVVLASNGSGPDLAMQRLMRRAGRAMMPAKPVLEVNPRHKLIEALSAKLDGYHADRRGGGDAAGFGAGAGRRSARRRGCLRSKGHGTSGGQYELADQFLWLTGEPFDFLRPRGDAQGAEWEWARPAASMAKSFPAGSGFSRPRRYQNVSGTFCRASAGASKKVSGRKPHGAAIRLLGTVSRRVL